MGRCNRVQRDGVGQVQDEGTEEPSGHSQGMYPQSASQRQGPRAEAGGGGSRLGFMRSVMGLSPLERVQEGTGGVEEAGSHSSLRGRGAGQPSVGLERQTNKRRACERRQVHTPRPRVSARLCLQDAAHWMAGRGLRTRVKYRGRAGPLRSPGALSVLCERDGPAVPGIPTLA